MEKQKSEFFALCCEFYKSTSDTDLLPKLEAIARELIRHNPPIEIVKLQIKALESVLKDNPQNLQCLKRYSILVEQILLSFSDYVKQLDALIRQIEQLSGSKVYLPNVMQQLEESYYMITKLAEITETLDNEVCQLRPYQMQLLKLQQISHTIIQNADFGVLVVDSSLKVKMFNKAASKILFLPENIVGEALDKVLEKLPRQNLNFLLKTLRSKNSRIEVEIQGNKKILEISSNNLVGQTGETEDVVIIIHDITSKEEEKKVLEENIKLATIGKLAAGVTHEIKNPLTVIKGFAQLLQKKNYEDPQVYTFLELICKEADRANNFIQDFLKLGRPQQPKKKIIDVHNIVAEALALVESHCFLNGIEIEKRVDCSYKILADPNQIKQVLINVLKNSIEAMEGPRPKKTLTIAIKEDIECRLLFITVKDTGCGIPTELLEKVSTPFFTTKKFGTGLGLNICKNIIEQHGGQIKVISNKEGTTVIIQLPFITEKWDIEKAPFRKEAATGYWSSK